MSVFAEKNNVCVMLYVYINVHLSKIYFKELPHCSVSTLGLLVWKPGTENVMFVMDKERTI
jgi:hypothetical protein